MHTKVPFSFQNSQIVDLIDIEELKSLIPGKLIQSKQRLKGYCNEKEKDPFLSYLTAGEYYPIEPSVFTRKFWERILQWVNEKLGYFESDLITCRCQLNVIPENALYHPLSISPHADSLNHNYDIAAINLPLQCAQQFSTAFWSHLLYGSFMGAFSNNPKGVSLDIKNHPFHARDLIKILDENQEYGDSTSVKLNGWKLKKIVNTPLHSATLYDGRNFHSPYLITSKTNKLASKWALRCSLAIFLVYKSLIPHVTASTDSISDKDRLYDRIIDSMHNANGIITPYKHV